ncbi:MAG: T9SS C-terminal target domain-containing protein, partial [Candidatus Latescibacterota bacterium]
LDTSDLFYPVLSDTNAILLTPFDAIYCPAENQDHVSITPESAVWFLEEITLPATAVVEAGGEAPARPALLPNSPNPFNPRTTIRFDLAEEAFTSLRVYDSAGRLAAVLVDGELPAGRHEAVFRADGLPSGVYFCRLTAGSVVLAEKMTLVR